MKKSIFLLYACIAAVLLNLKTLRVDVWDRLKSENFLPLLFVTIGLFWAYAIWIARQYGKMAAKQEHVIVKEGIASVSNEIIIRYLCYAIVPVLLFHLGAIWCLASIAENTMDIFKGYAIGYLPLLFVLITGYSILLLFRPDYALANSFVRTKVQVKEVASLPGLEQALGLYGLFLLLKHEGGMGPVFDPTARLAVRFFDIVLIRSHSKQRFVLLSDGEKLRADDVLKELKKRGLDRWMVKISKNYYINMLLVLYPIVKPKSNVVLRKEVYDSMSKKLNPTEIDKMCEIGRGMKNNPVKDFLADNHRMEYEGWDDFIPLR